MGLGPACGSGKDTARSGPGTRTRTRTTATRIAGWRSLSSSEERQRARAGMTRILAALLVYLLYALLGEILLEAWATGAAVRWPATFVLVLYAAVSAAAWKRIGD